MGPVPTARDYSLLGRIIVAAAARRFPRVGAGITRIASALFSAAIAAIVAAIVAVVRMTHVRDPFRRIVLNKLQGKLDMESLQLADQQQKTRNSLMLGNMAVEFG